MNREQQRKRIDRVRRTIIAGGIAGSLGVAGYLGFATQSAAASTTTSDDTGTTTSTTGTSSSDSDAYTSQYGDNSTQVSSGDGSSQATSSGS